MIFSAISGQHLIAAQVEVVDQRLEVELADPEVGHDPQVPHRLGLVVVDDVGIEIVGDVTGYRPVVRRCAVVEEHLDVLAAHPDEHGDLLHQAHETESAGITGQPSQLDDQIVEIIGEVLVQGLDEQPVRLPGRPR